jgi:hypothetical protein
MPSRNTCTLSVSFVKIMRVVVLVGLILNMIGSNGMIARAGDQPTFDSPESPVAVSPSLFGVDMYRIDPYFGLDKMVEAGAYWIRPRGVYWSDVQPVEGQDPDWSVLSGLETELQYATDNGMQVILLVSSTPEWARAISGVACGPIAQDKLADFGEFMFQLVNRYKDRVQYWELWNEPDIDPDLVSPDSRYGCWGDEDSADYGGGYYAEMLKVVFPKIKEADPNAQVLAGGLLLDCDPARVCPTQKSGMFLDGIINNGGGDYFDGVSYHAYDYYLGELGKYFNSKWLSSWDTTGPVSIAKAAYLESVLSGAGLGDKYLINTEASVVCDVGCDDTFEITKASYVAQSFGSAFESKLTGNLWFSSRAGYRHTDLLYDGTTSTPAYEAYGFAQSKLFDATYIGNLRNYAGINGYEFRRNDCPSTGEFCRLWLIWSLDGQNHAFELPDIPYGVYQYDGTLLGTDTTIQVTLEPKYVELPPEFRIRLPTLLRAFPILQNGDFESGVDAQGNPLGWLVTSGGAQGLSFSVISENPTTPEVDTSIPLGRYSMLLGDPNYPCSATGVPLGYAAVEQTITVPIVPDGVGLSLDFKYVIYTQDGSSSAVYDRFEVYLDDGNGPLLVYEDGRNEGIPGGDPVDCAKWYRLPESGWQDASIDLTQPVDYRGKEITILFQNWSRYDHWYNTFTYLDDVMVRIGD